MARIFRPERLSAAEFTEQQSVSTASTAVGVTLLFVVTLVTSWLAAVDPRLGWAAATVVSVVLGFMLTGTGARLIALALIPVSALTASAIVPFEGRYIPVLVLTAALLISFRGRAGASLEFVRGLPRPFVATVLAYLGWAGFATLSSVSISEVQYVGGMVMSLGAALVATPILLSSDAELRRFLAVVAISAAALLASGFVLAGVGGVSLFGHEVGVYFIEELVLLDSPTGFVFPQNYGPFVGPATESLAFGIAASSYLAATSGGRRAAAWWAVAAFCLLGLMSSFSREGLLMACLATATLAFGFLIRRRVVPGAFILTGLLLFVVVGTMTGRIAVLGRLDLVRAWYGADGVAALMNPIIAQRGEVPVEGQPSPRPSASPSSGDGSSFPPPQAAPILDVIQLKTTGSFQARLSLWSAAYRASLTAPLFGHGLGSNADAILPYLQGEDARLRGASVHSTVMRMLVELGIPGLLAYLAIIAGAIWLAIKAVFRLPDHVVLPLAGIVIASIAHQLFGTLLLGGLTYGSYVFVVALGLLAGSVVWSRSSADVAEGPGLP